MQMETGAVNVEIKQTRHLQIFSLTLSQLSCQLMQMETGAVNVEIKQTRHLQIFSLTLSQLSYPC